MPGVLRIDVGDPTRGRHQPSPKQLHGLVSTLLGETDEEHSAAEKPWSASIDRESRERLVIRVGWLRTSVPTGELPAAVRLGPATCPVLARSYIPSSFADLAACPAREVGMEFLTPTWFSRRGQALPFPEPHLVFTRLAERWNAHCQPGQGLPDPLRDALLDELELVSWSGSTWRMDLGRGVRTGFVGRMVVALADRVGTEVPGQPLPREASPVADFIPTAFGALAGFAEICGVGAQTTFGAGHVRAIRL